MIIRPFIIENSNARRARLTRLKDHKPNPRRIVNPAGFHLTVLRDRVGSLSDLSNSARSGKSHHFLDIANILRLMIGRGKPLPLLQMCAADCDADLTIYTVSDPTIVASLQVKPLFMFNRLVSIDRASLFHNAIDIDVWLDMPLYYFDSELCSPKKIIMAIGDTLGSHVDPETDPIVAALNSFTFEHDDARDLMQGFLLDVADIAIALAAPLLES